MSSRQDLLDELVLLRLSPDDGHPLVEKLYQAELRDARPSTDDFRYIDQKVQLTRAWKRAGSVGAYPQVAPSEDSIIRELQQASPLNRIYALINARDDWESDDEVRMKAYIFACFSELTYQAPTPNEIQICGPYRILPSFALHEHVERRTKLDVVRMLARVGDLRAEFIVTAEFVYFIFKTTKFNVIAVRGTACFKDWGINLNALKRRVKAFGYHRGFYDEASKAMPKLVVAVDLDLPLYFTGHSLGGAIASVLAQIWDGPQNIRTPYVFASPRFADGHSLHKKPYAYVAPDDLVPHLPPRLMGFSNYRFPPQLVPASGRWMSGAAALWQWLAPGKGHAAPHAVERYRQVLGEEVGEDFPSTVYSDATSGRTYSSV